MTAKQFELEVLSNNKYVIAEFDKDNYYLDDENSAKLLEYRLNELYEERNYFERKKCEYFNKWNNAHLDNINLREENKQLKGEVEHYKLMLMALEEQAKRLVQIHCFGDKK